MFPFPIAKPQNCDIQTFYGAGAGTIMFWNKPVGVSHVYMMLIGAGGNGDGTNGGGSGAVTVWYGAAQHVPDSLLILSGSAASTIYYRAKSTTLLLRAQAGVTQFGGGADSAGPFAASGFYKSTAGQNGSSGSVSASTTTFLSGGGNTGPVGNYGYSTPTSGTGYFFTQPIIVGVGGSGTSQGGIGCGGGVTSGTGGPGMVLIASW